MRINQELRQALFSNVGKVLGEKPISYRHLSIEKLGLNHEAELLGFPKIVVNQAQDLNPSSPTFGQFYYMVDYDPLP